jgi:hypothetical protein
MTSYSIIKADVHKNRDDILPLLKENLGGSLREEKYQWNYNQCPYGAAQCWLARHEKTNTFIGTSALFPRIILVEGKPEYAAIAGDFAVDEHHRNLMAALALQKVIQEKIHETGFKFIYLLPNEQAKNIFLRLKYKKIGRFTHFIKPLKSEYQANKYIHSYTQFKIFVKSVDFLIKKFGKEERYKTTLKYSIITPESFDGRFDVFWKNVSKHFTIIGERTSIFLNWRYIQHPSKKYQIFCLLDENKDIFGYIVYFLENNMCYIMDILFDPPKEVISPLLAEFSRFIRKKGAGSISVDYLGNSLLEKKLREFNFLPIKNEMDLIIYSPDMTDDSGLFNKENWHFFAGDNDV